MLAKQFNVTVKTINRVLWNAKKLKQQLLTASGDLRVIVRSSIGYNYYHKCLDLKTEKRNLNTKQTVLREFFVSDLDTSCVIAPCDADAPRGGWNRSRTLQNC